jgi:hypothetical protein
LSENGSYLAVTSNEVPMNDTTHAYLSVYRTSTGERILYGQLDTNVVRSPRPLDITRNGSYITVGTAGWVSGHGTCDDEGHSPATGTVYIFDNPDLVGSPGNRTYTLSDCVMTVRFSGDGHYLVAGFFWSYRADVLGVPALNFRATTGNYNSDPVYAVAPSYDGTNVSLGQGFARRVSLWRFDPINNTLQRLWQSNFARVCDITCGSHHRVVISDNGQFIFAKQEAQQAGDYPAFHLFNSTTPLNPNSKDPEWTYSASYFWPQGVDLSVANATYGIGTEGVDVHLWGDGNSVPPSGIPTYNFTANDTTTDAAISYPGPIFAVTDMDGYLYVFDASLTGDRLYWTWHT